jgi:hypothetical protein
MENKMHHLLEIILPNDTKNISSAIAEIMEPFDENGEDTHHTFWDFYVIGGRWAGQKQVSLFDQEKVKKFYELLKENKVTVSGLQCGKQEISPADQIPFVDNLWNDLFPENDGRPCPLFNHSNDQYDEYGIICGDILPVKECHDFECGHIIIAEKKEYSGKYEAEFMLQTDIWNGVTHQDTNWDGKIGSAVDLFKEKTKRYADEWKKKFENIDNWVSVTVDYHS